MSAAEILAELPQLTRSELAEVHAKVCELVGPVREDPVPSRSARIYSPRLADPTQAKLLVKRIVEVDADADL